MCSTGPTGGHSLGLESAVLPPPEAPGLEYPSCAGLSFSQEAFIWAAAQCLPTLPVPCLQPAKCQLGSPSRKDLEQLSSRLRSFIWQNKFTDLICAGRNRGVESAVILKPIFTAAFANLWGQLPGEMLLVGTIWGQKEERMEWGTEEEWERRGEWAAGGTETPFAFCATWWHQFHRFSVFSIILVKRLWDACLCGPSSLKQWPSSCRWRGIWRWWHVGALSLSRVLSVWCTGLGKVTLVCCWCCDDPRLDMCPWLPFLSQSLRRTVRWVSTTLNQRGKMLVLAVYHSAYATSLLSCATFWGRCALWSTCRRGRLWCAG